MARTGDPARQRLRTILYTRRVELGFANRQDFANDPGTRISYSVIRDLEGGYRANFDDDTLLRADLSYRFKPGSIQDVLCGGADPVPLAGEPRPQATADQAAEHLRSTPGASDAEIAAYLEILRAFSPARDAQQRRQRR